MCFVNYQPYGSIPEIKEIDNEHYLEPFMKLLSF
jgi:hypothetical protein